MVIQRWQSLLLLVAAAVMFCFTFCKLGQIQIASYTYDFTSLGFTQTGISTDVATAEVSHTWIFFTISLITAILLLIDIFLYKDLLLQKKVCLISVLFIFASALIVVCFGYYSSGEVVIEWTAVIIAPVIAFAAALAAYVCMRRDHNKLKAVDRIR